jgi:signal transduction histidine kinase
MRRLHEMSTRLVEAADLPNMLEEVLEATIALQGADFGNIQLCNPATGVLKIVAQRGFSPAFLEHFASVDMYEPSACGRALRAGERVIIEDVQEDPAYLPHRAVAAREGYRAVQSAPIRGRDGTVMGMLSTHFRKPHRPSDRGLQLTDLYMRLVSELIVRAQDEESVRAARDSADRANQAKSRFLATASHDLRQPLQTLSLLNGTLRRISRDATAIDAITQQEQAIGGMSRLLNALLDISKLESGAIKPDPTDFSVSTLFEELRQEFASLAGRKGLTLEVTPCEDSAHSDPSLVGQILRNLVSNAIKYTRAGWVSLRCLHDQPSSVRIEVLDTGIGIPTEHLRYICDEFYQVGVPSNTAREGYGLGLSIVQRIVTLLELRLDVQSELGKGSMFALTLPAGHAAMHPAPRAEPKPSAQIRPVQARVLLVEDDPAVLSATRMLLNSDGYQVAAAASMAEALAQATMDPRIDLLVTDYHLRDGETGTQVIASLRAALDQSLKSVLMTGDTSSAVKDLPRDPFLRIVSKPVYADELLTMLRELRDS